MPIDGDADVEGQNAAVDKAMADVAGDLAFRFADGQRAARRFQGVGQRLSEGQLTSLLIVGQTASQASQLLTHVDDAVNGSIAGDFAVLAEIGQDLIAAPMPRPFLELEAHAIDFLVEEPLRIDVAGDDPAMFAVTVDGWLRGGFGETAKHGSAGQPGEVGGIQQQQSLATDFLKQCRHPRHLGVDVRATIRHSVRLRLTGDEGRWLHKYYRDHVGSLAALLSTARVRPKHGAVFDLDNLVPKRPRLLGP